MKISAKNIFPFVIILLGLLLRLYLIPQRAPFEWDQERDAKVLAQIVESKRPTLIGPVVKGEGGFMLGPLYTYTALPTFILLNGHPLALPITSVVLDCITAILIFALAKKTFSERTAIITALIWNFSPLVIRSTLISWNVSLIPLWTTLFLSAYLAYHKQNPLKLMFALGLLEGFAWHIHVSIIPLPVIFTLITILKNNRLFSLRPIFYWLAGTLLPLTPLIAFDIRHQLINFNLLRSHFASSNPIELVALTTGLITKMLSFISTFLTGISQLYVGAILVALVIFTLFKNRSHRLFTPLLTIFLSLPLLILVNNDPWFPEYYYNAYLIPLSLVFALAFNLLHPKLIRISLLSLIIALTYGTYYLHFQDKLPYSYQNKISVTNGIKSFNANIDLRSELPTGRNHGFEYLLKHAQVNIDENSPFKVVLRDPADQSPSLINDQPPTNTDYFGGYRVDYFRL